MRKRVLVVLSTMVGLAIIAHFVVQRVATDPLRERIEAKLSQSLGLDVQIGELRMALLPSPHLNAEQVRVANLPGRASPDLLTIERLHIGIVLWRLVEQTIAIDMLEVTDADLHLETDSAGRLGFEQLIDAVSGAKTNPQAGASEGTDPTLRLALRAFEARALQIDYRDGRDGTTRSLILDSVSLRSEDLASELVLAAHGEFDGSRVSVSGRIGSLREFFEPTHPFAIDLEGQLFEARFKAKGSVLTPRALAGLDLEIDADIPELVVQDRALPEIGEIHFVGRLSDLDGKIGFEDLRLTNSTTQSVRIDIQGSIDDLTALEEVDLNGHMSTGSLDFLHPMLEKHFDFPLPSIARSSIKGTLTDRKGSLDLRAQLEAAMPKNEITLQAEGSLSNLTHTPDLDFQVDAQAKDLASLTALLPELPLHGPMGAVTAQARIETHQDAIAARAIKVDFGVHENVWAELEGSIADIVKLRGVDLEMVFGASSLHLLKEILARDLPHTPAFNGRLGLRDENGSIRLKHASLHGGNEGPIEIHLDARFTDLPGPDDVAVELGLRGSDTRILGALLGVDFPVISPVEFHGTVQGTEESLRSENLRLLLGESRFAGSLAAVLASNERPSLTARVTSKAVRLQDLGISPDQSPAYISGSDTSSSFDPVSPLPFERLRKIDLDLGLHFDQVRGLTGLDADDMRFQLRLRDGNLVISDAGAEYQGGHLKLDFRADARTADPKLNLTLSSNNLNLARIIRQFQEDSAYSGIIDAQFDLEARGSTLDALRRSLSGRAGAAVRDGNAASRIAQEFVFDIAEIAFRGLHLKKTPKIGCGMIELEIDHGVANVLKLLVSEKDVSIMGTGQVDFVTETYDLRIVPSTRNPGILSVAPEVKVTGALGHPEFHAVKRTLVTSFGSGFVRGVLKLPETLLNPFSWGSDDSKDLDVACRLEASSPPSVP